MNLRWNPYPLGARIWFFLYASRVNIGFNHLPSDLNVLLWTVLFLVHQQRGVARLSMELNFATSREFVSKLAKIISTWYSSKSEIRTNMSTCYSHNFKNRFVKLPLRKVWRPKSREKKFHQPTCRHIIPAKVTWFWFSFQG